MAKSLSIVQQLHTSRTVINNTLNVDYILAAFIPFGYAVARFKAVQVVADNGLQVGVKGRGRSALELADFGQYLA